MDKSFRIADVEVPRFLYGTAWKENNTQRLTELALHEGFRGIDTANQRRHYHEAAVGDAIATSIKSGLLVRDELFLQTKFTFRAGQDHRLPYDPQAPIRTQVEQSFASSREHLGCEFIDSYLLHGPARRSGLCEDDWEAWRSMEILHDSGHVRFLGVSNVTFEQLELLYRGARIRPRFVQNRCYATSGWDRRIREFCAANGMIYQGFSLLTANRDAMARPALTGIAARYQRTVNEIVFRFAIEVGMMVLTGTTKGSHMRADLEVFSFGLEPDEVESIETVVLR